jgi:exonuclease SbcC
MLELKLKKYRRFIENASSQDGFHTATFDAGLTIVTGPNGAGKTTLVEALSYALYGPRQGQKAEITPDGLTGGTEVQCEFEMDGKVIKVWRSADRAALWIDGIMQVKNTSGSISAVELQLKGLLGGLSHEHFEHTYFARQGDTAGLIEAKDATRRETISQILQLDVLQKAVDLQGGERVKVRQRIKERGRTVCMELEFEDAVMNLLDSAIKPQTSAAKRQEYISRFDTQINTALDARSEAVTASTKALASAQALLSERTGVRDAQVLVRDEARKKLTAHEALEMKFNAVGQEISTLRALLARAQRDIDGLQGRVSTAEKCADAARIHAELETQIASYTNRLAVLPRVKDRFERLTKARSDHKAKETKLAGLAHLDEALTQVTAEECEAKKRREQLEADPTLADYNVWRGRKAALDHQEAQTRDALTTLGKTEATAQCPTCDRPLDEHQRDSRIQHLETWLTSTLPQLSEDIAQEEAALKRRRAEWIQARQGARDECDAATKKLFQVTRQIDERSTLQEQLITAAREVEDAQTAWDELGELHPYDPDEAERVRGEKDTLNKRAVELKKEADQYARLADLQADLVSKRSEIEGYTEQIHQKTKAQGEIGYNPKTHAAAKIALTQAQDELDVLQRQQHEAEMLAQNAQSEAKQAALAFKKGNEVRNPWQEATVDFRRADRLYALLSDFLSYYFDANTQQVSQRASDLILYAVTDGSILGIEFDEEGRLYYFDASHHRRLVSKARPSGGEKALIGLCLRIALAEQARAIARTGKLSFLVLDEVLSSLDDERRDAVQRIFEQVQQTGVFQHIILITHLQAVKDQWQANRLDVRKLPGGGSQFATGSDNMMMEPGDSIDNESAYSAS